MAESFIPPRRYSWVRVDRLNAMGCGWEIKVGTVKGESK